jgi:hypothetical protein
MSFASRRKPKRIGDDGGDNGEEGKEAGTLHINILMRCSLGNWRCDPKPNGALTGGALAGPEWKRQLYDAIDFQLLLIS